MDGSNGTPAGAYREQTVEITLGPQGGFRKRQRGHPDALSGRRPGPRMTALPRRLVTPSIARTRLRAHHQLNPLTFLPDTFPAAPVSIH